MYRHNLEWRPEESHSTPQIAHPLASTVGASSDSICFSFAFIDKKSTNQQFFKPTKNGRNAHSIIRTLANNAKIAHTEVPLCAEASPAEA
jgi:hypothetical protein